VVWALRSKGAKQATRIPGCEFWMALMQKAGKSQQPVFLVGAKPSVLNQVEAKLRSDWNVSIVGKQDGYFSGEQQEELIERIKASEAMIVTVAMGSPRQELFISQCRNAHPNAFYMGVGGTYDVYTGNVQRAPEWACKFNIEWLYRLLSNPTRFGRQIVLLEYLWLLLLKKI
jgi:UDP-N-acetyl-D-mannosaminouronate:lipid I N-acetyl-D-mannosaminouronosyltransferase